MLLRLVPAGTTIPFVRFRPIFFLVSAVLIAASVGLFLTRGLNYGIDFAGGVLMEVRYEQPADIGAIRDQLSALGLGDVQIQEFGEPTDILIRVEKQEGGATAQQDAVDAVRGALGEQVTYRRTEVVGPKVGDELIEAGIIAVLAALFAILCYVWFRFEWQFGLAAVVALAHDVISTIGVFSLTQLDFNLATVAAILTIAGYSINDTVVLFDRVRENLRKFKKLPLTDLFNRSVNETLSRTVLTSLTTLLALLALYFFGGEVIRGFAFAMIWGVLVGTYSSICVALPVVLYLNIRRGTEEESKAEAEAAAGS